MCEIKASLPFLKIETLITTFLRASWPVATFAWHYSVLALVACSVAGFLRAVCCSLFLILKKNGSNYLSLWERREPQSTKNRKYLKLATGRLEQGQAYEHFVWLACYWPASEADRLFTGMDDVLRDRFGNLAPCLLSSKCQLRAKSDAVFWFWRQTY